MENKKQVMLLIVDKMNKHNKQLMQHMVNNEKYDVWCMDQSARYQPRCRWRHNKSWATEDQVLACRFDLVVFSPTAKHNVSWLEGDEDEDELLASLCLADVPCFVYESKRLRGLTAADVDKREDANNKEKEKEKTTKKKENATTSNVTCKERFRACCLSLLPRMRLLQLPTPIVEGKENESVLIEFRVLPHLEFLLRNTLFRLPSAEWSHTVVCGAGNVDFVRSLVDSLGQNIGVRVICLEKVVNLTQQEYSNMLLTSSFWRQFRGEKLLVYQEDTCLFGSNIKDFLKWDYIGAPWPLEYGINQHGVGNGGFSLRSKWVMLACCEHSPTTAIRIPPVVAEYMKNNGLNTVPEDVFFTRVMEKFGYGCIADHETAATFSSESFPSTNSLGGHQFWMHNPKWEQRVRRLVPRFVPAHMPFDVIEHRGGWKDVLTELYARGLYASTKQREKETKKENQGEENDDVLLLCDVVERAFLWEENETRQLLKRAPKWCGIVHCTHITPPYLDVVNISQLFLPGSLFLQHLDGCRCLFGLSPNVTEYLTERLRALNRASVPPVYLLRHPIETEASLKKFDMSLFESNPSKQLLQIGQQLRKMTSLYCCEVPFPYEKLWLTGTKNMRKLTDLFTKECAYLGLRLDMGAVNRAYVDVSEYDALLSKNVVLLDMFDASANNTVLECIVRATPLLVIRMPATEYYLGSEYPLFFERLEEVPGLLSDVSLIQRAHVYLKELSQSTSMVWDVATFVSTLSSLCMRHRCDVECEQG